MLKIQNRIEKKQQSKNDSSRDKNQFNQWMSAIDDLVN